jgi:hypothetical protein
MRPLCGPVPRAYAAIWHRALWAALPWHAPMPRHPPTGTHGRMRMALACVALAVCVAGLAAQCAPRTAGGPARQGPVTGTVPAGQAPGQGRPCTAQRGGIRCLATRTGRALP